MNKLETRAVEDKVVATPEAKKPDVIAEARSRLYLEKYEKSAADAIAKAKAGIRKALN